VIEGVARRLQTDSLRYIFWGCGEIVAGVLGVVWGGRRFAFAEDFEAGEEGGAVRIGDEGGGVAVAVERDIGGVAVFDAGEFAGGEDVLDFSDTNFFVVEAVVLLDFERQKGCNLQRQVSRILSVGLGVERPGVARGCI
jgi:hypothetical protein